MKGIADLFPYLSAHWVNYIQESGFRQLPNAPYPKGANGGSRADATPPNGGPAGSDVAFLKAQLLDTYGIDVAILTGVFYNLCFLPNPGFATGRPDPLPGDPTLASYKAPTSDPRVTVTPIDFMCRITSGRASPRNVPRRFSGTSGCSLV